MSTTTTRGVASLALMALAGSALAGPLPMPPVDLDVYDVSFQDGRRASSGPGPQVVNRVIGLAESGSPEQPWPIAACFAEGTPPEIMAAVNAAIQAGYANRYELGVRWAIGNDGDPITLTWSLIPDGVQLPHYNGANPTAASNLFAALDAQFASQGGRAQWISLFQQSFARWAAFTGLNYVRVQSGANDWDDGAAWGTGSGSNRGIIRIGGRPLDGASNVLAFNQFPQSGDMVMDTQENWAQSGGNFLFFRNTIMHEHGHGLGFAHSCPGNSTKLMEPLLATNFDGIQQDEIRAGQAYYGDPSEPNNSFGQATDLGALTAGQNVPLGNGPVGVIIANSATLSIDATSELDWFKFTLTEPRLIDVTLTPIGNSYPAGPQNQNGSCSAGTTENSLGAADLMLTVYKQNGTSILRTNDESAAGGLETLSGLMVASGTTYVRVSADGAVNGTQLYKLTLTVRSTNISPSASDGTFTDKVRVNWATIPDATSYQVYRNTTNATFGGSTVGTVSAPTISFDDTTAVPGTNYFYFVRALQPDDPGYRFTSDSGDPGRRNANPVADAGPDQVVIDADLSGSETVTLDGSASNDPDGSISIYRWMEGVTLLAQSASPTANVSLAQGVHTITLTVFDNSSGTHTDTVTVEVTPPGSNCGNQDFNGDGDFGTDQDIEAFFACLAGSCCGTCWVGGQDFNGDGDFGTDQDIEAFFRVLAGGTC